MNIREFCAKYNITAKVERISSRRDGGVTDDAE